MAPPSRVRTSFFAGRGVRDLDRLAAAEAWFQGPAAARRHPGDATLTVGEAVERHRLLLRS